MRSGTAATRWRAAVVASASALALGACVGAIGRGEFDDEVRSRGGGLDGSLVAEAVDAIEAEVGADGIRVRSVNVTPGAVVMQVQVPGDPEELDTYRFGSSGMYGGHGLDGPTPVARSGGEPPIDAQVFEPSAAGVDRLDEMVAAALDAAGIEGGYATAASIGRPGDGGDPVTSVSVTNERRSASVRFSPDGSVVEVVAQ